MSENRVCCNCRHNIRTGEITDIKCHCDVDGHTIGYVECMTGWCRHWARDHKFDNYEDDRKESGLIVED